MIVGALQHMLLRTSSKFQSAQMVNNQPLLFKHYPHLRSYSYAASKTQAIQLHHARQREPVAPKAFVDYISTYAGTADEAKATVRILKKIFTNDVASNYNWQGTAPKAAFKELRICEAVLAAVLKKIPSSRLEVAERTVKVWLKNAPYRK